MSKYYFNNVCTDEFTWVNYAINKLWNKQVPFFKLHSRLNGSHGSHLDIVKWLWIAPLISQFQMTRDNQVIKMSPFSTSDTLPLPPHLNNKSALECFLKQKEKKERKENREKWLSLHFQVNHIFIFRGKDGKTAKGGKKSPVKGASACVKAPGFLNSSLRTG